MKRRFAGFALAAISGLCANPPAHFVTIQLPPGVSSQRFFGRYVLAGQDFGGWIEPRADVTSYAIDTTYRGHAASGIRAILYAPGCAIRTLDVPLPARTNPAFPFACRPVPQIRIAGTIARPSRFQGHQLTLQARWVIRWAAAFLGLDGNMVTSIPVGETADLSPERKFVLSVPDPDPDAELQIWARERDTGDLLAQLIPMGDDRLGRTKMGDLQVRGGPPPEIAFSLCAVDDGWRVHDKYGFTTRPLSDDACSR
jgi:hypothetical protein